MKSVREWLGGKLAGTGGKSTMLAGLVAALCGPVTAHEVLPSLFNVDVNATTVTIRVETIGEAMVAGIDLSGVENTDNAPEAELYNTLRATPAAEFAAQVEEAWPNLRDGFLISSGGKTVPLTLDRVEVIPQPALDLPRDTVMYLTGSLPGGGDPVVVGWVPKFGPLIVRQEGEGDDLYSAYLLEGELSDPLPRSGIAIVERGQAFARYVLIGFEHIVPKGVDHILFVLGLFFFSLRWGALLWQVSAFTLAHTITLALATLKIVEIPPSIVEPLIAASIVFVAVENIFGGKKAHIGAQRIAIVFVFGLLHGLGFASILGEIGLDPTQFFLSLIAFNVGVELGQIAIIVVALLLVGLPFGRTAFYRVGIAIPASVFIAAIGLYWAVERGAPLFGVDLVLPNLPLFG